MRIFYILVTVFGLTCLYFLPAQAQTGNSLTVEECVKLGLDHSYRLQAAHANTKEAEAAYRQTKTGKLPAIRAQASYMRLSSNIPEVDFALPGADTTYTFLPVELNQFHTELSIQQLLFAGGRLNNRVEAAAHQANAAQLTEKQGRAEVAFKIREAYWNLYSALTMHKTLKSALDRINEHLQNVRNRVEAGTALRIDLLNAKTRLSEVRLDSIESRNRVRVTRLELNRLIGAPTNTTVEPVSPDKPETLPFGMDELVQRALEQKPGLHALSEQVDAREAQIDALQSKWFPEISLVGRYVYARPNQYFFAERDQFRGTWEAGISLQWNIWAGGRKTTETSQAKARLHGAEAQLAHKREQVTVMATRQYLELQRAKKAIDVAAVNVEAAGEAFQSARRQFKAGVILSEQVLDAEYAYRKAQARHTKAIADYCIAYAAILSTLGQIWEI